MIKWPYFGVMVTSMAACAFEFDTPVDPILGGAVFPMELHTVTPCRLVDTRQDLGGSTLSSGVAQDMQIVGECGIPDGAHAIAACVAAIEPTGLGNLKITPGRVLDPPPPIVGFEAGNVHSNNAILPLATDGTITVEPLVVTNGSLEMILDVSGYFVNREN